MHTHFIEFIVCACFPGHHEVGRSNHRADRDIFHYSLHDSRLHLFQTIFPITNFGLIACCKAARDSKKTDGIRCSSHEVDLNRWCWGLEPASAPGQLTATNPTNHCYECNGKLKDWAGCTEMFIHIFFGLFYSKDVCVMERHLYSWVPSGFRVTPWH